MADNTKIEWADATFNPWIGCTRVSPACDHCYAAVSTPARTLGVEWGAGQPRRRTSPGNWKWPLRWNAEPFAGCNECGHRGIPLKNGAMWHCAECGHVNLSPARRRVFCASLADVFDNEVDPQWRADLFALILATPNLDWLLLTKRIGNAHRMMSGDAGATFGRDLEAEGLWPIPNVWLGATICNQAEADRDIPKLLATPARVRFLSMEPLLGRVDLCEPLGMWWNQTMGCFESIGTRWNPRNLSWVVAGGESGPGARPMHPDWARSLRDQCAAAGVPFLFKQWGEWQVASIANGHSDSDMARNAAHWVFPDGVMQKPSSLRDGWAGGDPWAMVKVGKKAAGRELDGRLHDGYPEVRHA